MSRILGIKVILILQVIQLFSIRDVFAVADPYPDIYNHPNFPRDMLPFCGISKPTARIIGGHNATLGQYPWLARIGYIIEGKVVYGCGGAIISRKTVLTAAHCVKDLGNKKLKDVILGEFNASSNIDCDNNGRCADPVQQIGIKLVVSPNTFKIATYRHDISLIILKTPAKFSEWVKPICLPYGEILRQSNEGTNAEVAGWGKQDSYDDNGINYLKWVKLPIVDVEKCIKIFKGFYVVEKFEQLCAGGIEGQDSCGGDSGGPLMKVLSIDNLKSRYFAIGIVSYGSTNCGTADVPGVYSNVAFFIRWILKYMQN